MTFDVEATIKKLPAIAPSIKHNKVPVRMTLANQVRIQNNELLWTDGVSAISVPVEAENAMLNRDGETTDQVSVLPDNYERVIYPAYKTGAVIGKLTSKDITAFFKGVKNENVQVIFTDNVMTLIRTDDNTTMEIMVDGDVNHERRQFNGTLLRDMLKFIAYLQRTSKDDVIVQDFTDNLSPIVFRQGDVVTQLSPTRMR